MSRITVQGLAAQVAEQNERTEQALSGIMNVLGGLVEAVTSGGTFNTAAPVVDITSAPSASKTKVEMPTELREGFAMVRDTAEAMKPLNRALAQVCKGQPWVKATERSESDIAHAITLVEAEHGKKIAKAALAALTVRLEAAEKREATK